MVESTHVQHISISRRPGIDRRTMIGASAFAVPVVVVSTAVPAFAATSGAVTLELTPSETHPGATVQLTGSQPHSPGAVVLLTSSDGNVSFGNATPTTDSDGNFGTTVSVSSSATSGTATITARVGGTSGQATLTYAPSTVTMSSQPGSVIRGSGGSLVGRVVDGSTPVPQLAVALSSPQRDLTLARSSVTTDSAGYFSTNFSTASGATPGSVTVGASAGGGSGSTTLNITTNAPSISIAATVKNRGGRSTIVVISGTVTASDGSHPSNAAVSVDLGGTGTVTLHTNSSGYYSYFYQIGLMGDPDSPMTITASTALASGTISNSAEYLPAGVNPPYSFVLDPVSPSPVMRGKTAQIGGTVLDVYGASVGTEPTVTLSSSDPVVSFASSTVTAGTTGVFDATASVAAGYPSGTATITITAGDATTTFDLPYLEPVTGVRTWLSTSSVLADSTTTVGGTVSGGSGPLANRTVTLASSNSSITLAATTLTTDANGRFRTTATIPAGISPTTVQMTATSETVQGSAPLSIVANANYVALNLSTKGSGPQGSQWIVAGQVPDNGGVAVPLVIQFSTTSSPINTRTRTNGTYTFIFTPGGGGINPPYAEATVSLTAKASGGDRTNSGVFIPS